MKLSGYSAFLLASTAIVVAIPAARGSEFNVPGGTMKSALDLYAKQAGIQLIYTDDAVRGQRSAGVKGELPADEALTRILGGSGLVVHRHPAGVVAVVRGQSADAAAIVPSLQLAQASPSRAAVETVTVTSSKLGGADVQSIPIAITALSQEQLTSRQIAGGPDLIKEVPNLTFTKTNFTGYSIQIRGIGTQAISVTTDPAVAVSFNDTPFIRNHFFEQEFYDVAQVEVLRGPQGTLYGRNATAGVVNVTSAVPTDQFEAMGSADIGNYHNRRLEGMLNLPLVGDKLMLRFAGEWTKRDGYSTNSLTSSPIDGRDLWSGRASLRWQPTETFHADFVWEHFQEDDDRLRSAKQLCGRSDPPSSILGVPTGGGAIVTGYLTQICKPASMYSPEAYGVPNSLALPYYGGIIGVGGWSIKTPMSDFPGERRDAYASTTQSRDLRVIESTLDPEYRAKNDTLELNAVWNVTPTLTVNSETGYNRDFLWSTEDFNRFNTQPGIFAYDPDLYTGDLTTPDGNYRCFDGTLSMGSDQCGVVGAFGGTPTGYFCDPQLGCSNRLVGEDLSEEHSWQLSQELRLSSNYSGPFNFSVGGNYMHYETEENYYVFFNTLTAFAAIDGLGGRRPVNPWNGGDHNQQCMGNGRQYANPKIPSSAEGCLGYIDPNPLTSLDGQGHNYFLSMNPYNLNSYALFGEAYYNVTSDLKLTAGLRWTDDQKHFVEIPSELLTAGFGYPVTGALDQEWTEWTGRFVANWSPKVAFTDQTMLYASYAHGYKAGGANPPGAVFLHYQKSDISSPTHPATFDPEFNDAFEIGTKNTLLDGAVTLNGDVFYYDYKGYQISQIVDRTSVNLNFNATSVGAELTATWEPIPGLKFGFNGGYEQTKLADGSKAIDLMDRTAGNANWVLVKPFVTQASNCVVPAYVLAYALNPAYGSTNDQIIPSMCGDTYGLGVDPVSGKTYTAYPTGETAANHGNAIDPSYPGFDPLAGTPGHPYTGQNTFNGVDYGPAPNNGAGFYKNLSGNELPNAPHYTMSLTADYTMPVTPDWAATLHTDFYWQSKSWARVYNDDPYDRIRGYTNLNLALILSDSTGWQVMGYIKNVFDNTAITGAFLNSDDTGLTTNIFLTDPRLFGVRVTKRFGEGSWNEGGGLDFIRDIFTDTDGKPPLLTLTLGGNFNNVLAAENEVYNPGYTRPGGIAFTGPGFGGSGKSGVAEPGTQTLTQLMEGQGFPSPASYEQTPASSFDWEGQLAIQPQDSDWVLKAGIRYGRSGRRQGVHESQIPGTRTRFLLFGHRYVPCTNTAIGTYNACHSGFNRKFIDARGDQTEQHTIMDFEVGMNIGIGLFGEEGQGNISGGMRIAQFKSHGHTDVNSDPEYYFGELGQYHNAFESLSDEDRWFHGIGPELTWEANQPILGNASDGEITLDWGVNAAVLFGRQSVTAQHFSSYCHVNGSASPSGCLTAAHYDPGYHSQTKTTRRTRRKVVPNLGGYIGASARYNNAKISFGYKADTFFGAMDGGQETAKDYNRGFYGPYMKVSIGLGG
jgi:outer membrane receptor protein involved in Fe transport